MLIPFSDLPNHARVWIYQASRSFSFKEKEKLDQQLQEFFKKMDCSRNQFSNRL